RFHGQNYSSSRPSFRYVRNFSFACLKRVSMNSAKPTNNCSVLGTGDNPADHAHVSVTTPMKTKLKEFQNDPIYGTKFANGMDPTREKAVTRARRQGNVRPIGGHGA